MMREKATTCAHCGNASIALLPVEVVHRKTVQRCTLQFCSRCASRPAATWRLTWQPVSGPARIEGER